MSDHNPNTTEPSPKAPLDLWALVELMGRQRIVGRVSEQCVAGTTMLRVDVPDQQGQTRFTRFYGGQAIYAISPLGEREALAMASAMDPAPIRAYELPQLAGGSEGVEDGGDGGECGYEE